MLKGCTSFGYNKTFIWTPHRPTSDLFCLGQKYWSRAIALDQYFRLDKINPMLDSTLSNKWLSQSVSMRNSRIAICENGHCLVANMN